MIPCISPEQAAALIRDGQMVMVGGNGGTGAPEAVLAAIGARFIGGGGPSGLVLFHVTGVGAVVEQGLCHLAHPGLVSRVIGGNYGLQLPFMRLIRENLLEAYNFPQGVMSQLCRAMAAKQPGVVTQIGLGTYMDPRLGGGRMNARTLEALVEPAQFGGEEYLFYKAPGRPDIAIIRGTSADEDGYVSMEHEATTREDLSIAQAVHNAGGVVICQVKRLVRRGSLHPQMVKIPGYLIDYLVVDPAQMQTYATPYEPGRSGETRLPRGAVAPDAAGIRRVIARRAAFELSAGDIVNLGVGVSAMIPNVAAEEQIDELITLTVESGVIGGVPGHGREFGTAINPRAIIDQAYQFDFYQGGGLTAAFLSFAEVDEDGNVNVTRFGDRFDGAGGFIDITQNTRRLVFSGTLTGGAQDIGLVAGGLAIRRDGPIGKFVAEVGQVSFSGQRARARGQQVTYVTERAVFELAPGGLVLTEIAPGVRVQEDVLDRIGFPMPISPELKPMDGRIFRDGPMGLREGFLARGLRKRN